MKTQLIGVISATENEIAPFINQLAKVQTSTRAMLRFHVGKFAGLNVVALYSGVCKVNAAIAAQVLIERYNAGKVIMIGVAGAIDAALNICDTIIASEIVYHDVAPEILTEYHPWMKHPYFVADPELRAGILRANAEDKTVRVGRIATGEPFIDQEGRDEIIKNHAPSCVDMETAGVAHACYVNAIPFAAIRSMSDTPHESGNNAFEKYGSAAAEKSVRVLCNYLNSI